MLEHDMRNLIAGANTDLSGRTISITVEYPAAPGLDLDVSCFLLSADGRVRSDADMCFYGQPAVAGGAVSLTDTAVGRARFTVNFGAIPADVASIPIVATVYENKATISSYSLIRLSTSERIGTEVQGSGRPESAIILGELYRKNSGWKFRSVLAGYAGGLAELARHYGVSIKSDAPPLPTKISLVKFVEQKAPALINLAKKADAVIEKQNLKTTVARVALVLDASGSMKRQYRQGRVQELLNRLLPLAAQFDDDQQIDCWAFGSKALNIGPITFENFENFTFSAHGGWEAWNLGPRTNNEPEVIETVLKYYQNVRRDIPVYVLFLSDGGVSQNRRITDLIVRAATRPLFWQFMGLAGKEYGVLEKLDEMTGRIVDNCGFFAIDDLHDISEEELYARMLQEFPSWIRSATARGILQRQS